MLLVAESEAPVRQLSSDPGRPIQVFDTRGQRAAVPLAPETLTRRLNLTKVRFPMPACPFQHFRATPRLQIPLRSGVPKISMYFIAGPWIAVEGWGDGISQDS